MKNVCILTLLKTNRGVSLVEILAAVAIITMVIGPFMGGFIEATKNNVFSEIKIKSSTLAQKSMEEIKAMNYIELDRRMALDKIVGSNYIEYSVDGTYLIKYKIEKEISTVDVTPSYVMEDLSNITYSISFEVSSTGITISTHLPSISQTINFAENANLNNCSLRYVDNMGIKTFTVKDAASQTIACGNLENDNPIYYKVSFLNGCNQNFTLSVNFDAIDVLDESDVGAKKIRFYVIDDVNSNFTLSNTGEKQIRTLNKLTTSIQSYRNILYKIEVVVENNGEEINKLVSYIKK